MRRIKRPQEISQERLEKVAKMKRRIEALQDDVAMEMSAFALELSQGAVVERGYYGLVYVSSGRRPKWRQICEEKLGIKFVEEIIRITPEGAKSLQLAEVAS